MTAKLIFNLQKYIINSNLICNLNLKIYWI